MKKVNLSGVAKDTSRYDGVMMIHEFVRTDIGAVYSRHVSGKFKSEWVYHGTVSLDQVAYNGKTWNTLPRLLQLKTDLIRLPV